MTVIGNIGSDPELRFTPSGAAVCNFSVASTPRTFDRQTNEWKDGVATWYNCAAWREMAENCAESLTRGMQVIVVGDLTLREYESRDGVKGKSLDLNVDNVGPALRFASAKVTRMNRGQGQNSGGGGGGQRQGGGQQGGQGYGGGQQAPANDPWGTPSGGGAPANDPWATGGQGDEPPF